MARPAEPEASYTAPDSCLHPMVCDPDFITSWLNSHTPGANSGANDACSIYSNTCEDADGGTRDASPDRGAFEWI